MTEKTAKSNAGKGWLCCAAIIALCMISCFAQNGTYTTKKAVSYTHLKVLALVLAFACAFTMFAGAASYSDKADIKATTAVDMLSSLGVIQGYEDGSFKPNTTVTRAQMAKMIFTIMNGGNDKMCIRDRHSTRNTFLCTVISHTSFGNIPLFRCFCNRKIVHMLTSERDSCIYSIPYYRQEIYRSTE